MEQLTPSAASIAGATLIITFCLIVLQEAVNGFHDIANAVATVIYSRAMKPYAAVTMSAVCNFIGVLVGGTSVAFSLVYLLPANMVAGINTVSEVSLFLAMIVTAVGWNLGTWWLGIPNSTTHAYIGSIICIAMADAFLLGQPVAEQIHWHQGEKIMTALIVSPLVGFLLGVMLLRLIRGMVHDPAMFQPTEGENKPGLAIRGLLIAGSAGVSLMHGSNDGQKSIGLMMIALFGLFPALYGLDPGRLNAADFDRLIAVVEEVRNLGEQFEEGAASGKLDDGMNLAGARKLHEELVSKKNGNAMSAATAITVRKEILAIHGQVAKLLKSREVKSRLTDVQAERLEQAHAVLAEFIEHVPWWVMLLSASALGGGSMVGYRKIVTTLGEKMGSSRMNPAQGTAAQMSAVASIALADLGGLPVSTTHVLSSAVVGTVVATPHQHINQKTIASIIMTWVTTLPGTVMLSFAMGIVFHLAFT